MASNSKLTRIFNALADTLGDIVAEGVPLQDPETGKITVQPAAAAYLAVARQFLKDNNYEADADKHPGLKKLAQTLPFAGEEELALAGKEQYTH
ncbi:hypothetical protein A7981_05720 [Methylovorus sp. MM2]|uniref:hypothetical protein n=1 Tax=Methylovorus sp. MM2 TaxID=1848038 RepID=UPI0007E04078|nr:hypothetical protein [Methylovorus sp. MM2]OAM52931.1 hypothetical protein A7981_05720 [Methylovorus sp. MM2]